jgi:hypothetical protein
MLSGIWRVQYTSIRNIRCYEEVYFFRTEILKIFDKKQSFNYRYKLFNSKLLLVNSHKVILCVRIKLKFKKMKLINMNGDITILRNFSSFKFRKRTVSGKSIHRVKQR